MTSDVPNAAAAVCTSSRSSSMAVWFVQGKNSDQGPLSPADLLSLVREGTVTADSMIRKNDSPWFSASEVGGLFEAARRPTIEHYCPKCDVRVSSPPSQCPRCLEAMENTHKRIIEHSIGKPSTPSPKSTIGSASSAKRWLQRRIKKDDA